MLILNLGIDWFKNYSYLKLEIYRKKIQKFFPIFKNH